VDRLKKKEVVEKIYKRVPDVKKGQIKQIVAAFEEILHEEILEKGKIYQFPFGVLYAKDFPAKKAKAFGKVVEIPARRKVMLRTGKNGIKKL